MMAAFSLAALLRLRRLEHDQAAAEVSLSRARAAELAARRRSTESALSHLASPNGSSHTLAWTAAARAASSSSLGDLQVLKDETDRQTAAAAAVLAQARAQTITLEKLEERHDATVASEALRHEQNTLDELSSRSFDPAEQGGAS
jgi:flagellar FliJ protein